MGRQPRYDPATLDWTSRRSIELVVSDAGAPRRLDAADRVAVVRNFYHHGKFWRAEIPLDAVREVLGQAFNFSQIKTRVGPSGREIVFGKNGLPKRKIPALNHVQTRFRLQPGRGVRLFDLEAPAGSAAPAHEVDDFVYTIEAVGPVGVNFNFRDAMSGALVSAHRFLSTQEMVFERIVVENQYLTESPPLPLSEGQLRKLLVESLLRSDRAGATEAYYLYRCGGTNNCTSSPFQILDRVAEYSWRQWLCSCLYRLPVNPRLYLWLRGMDSDPSIRKLVREEFEEYVRDKETQRRKREYVREKVKQVRAARGLPAKAAE